MTRNPGEWLRERLLGRVTDAALCAMLGIGWLCGVAVVLWTTLAGGFGFGWTMWLVLLLPGAAFVGAALYKARSGWRLSDMKKGAGAEETVGQAIEYALTRPSCAVAHNVEEIASVGDIDHLVATPLGLWVIETKYRRVPPSEFPRTLRYIADNVAGVRKWAPGTRVTGCLVFARAQEPPPKATYEWGSETIRCFKNAKSLAHQLRAEAHNEGGSSDLARRVWKLGSLVSEADQSAAAG